VGAVQQANAANERDVFWGQDGDDTINTHHPLSSSSPVIAPVPDRVGCRAGTDEVLNADPTDGIASDCEDVSFRSTG
jgi:hypothetical protein